MWIASTTHANHIYRLPHPQDSQTSNTCSQYAISLQQEQVWLLKIVVVNVSLIQNMVQDFKAEDNHIVQVNGKASAADGDVQEK
ncbi:hypothetical protein H5410_023357 [Solanum commersonii]|uniref:Uncharacterized protein n=1 Tax=Solanum commersonii TaxID=4109 RepID=A0A9J5ZJH4_SOLCO|nr:hypothetical protein H5410_023357 [Solanum commersonii]